MLRGIFSRRAAVVALIALGMSSAHAEKGPAKEILKPNTERPKNAIVLFDGSNTDAWQQRGDGPCKWKLNENEKSMISGGGDIVTKEKFGAYQLHVEFKEPKLAEDKHGQERGNSGVYQQDRYELQVLDSYHNDTYPDGACGAIYGQTPPLKNASKPPLQWQTYDITLWPAKFKDGKKVEDARITVYQNGELIQDYTDIKGPTGAGAPETDAPGPIRLQDHGNPVEFRNIWIVPLEEKSGGSQK